MTHQEQRLADLAEQLESSVLAASTGGRFVAAWDLPSERDLNALHAELQRGVCQQRLLRTFEVLPFPT